LESDRLQAAAPCNSALQTTKTGIYFGYKKQGGRVTNYRKELCQNVMNECRRLGVLLTERRPGAWSTRLQIREVIEMAEAALGETPHGSREHERRMLAPLLERCSSLVSKLKEMRADNGEMVLTQALN
jgi:hypothetical protein